MKVTITLLFTLLLLSACGSVEEVPAEEINEPSLPVDTLEVTNFIGEELGDSTNTFGIIADAEYHLETGNILLLDNGASCIKEYTPTAEYIRQISRQGSAPGELSPMTFEFFQMGNMVLASNILKQGFVVFDDSLDYLDEISNWPQMPPMQCLGLSDSVYAAYKPDFSEAGEGEFVMYRRIVTYNYGEENYSAVLWEDSTELSLNDLISNSSFVVTDLLQGVTLSGNSDIILFSLRESEDYTVHAWYPDGTDAFTITMPLEPVPKTEEEIAEEKAYMEGFFSQMGAQGMGEFVPEPYRDMVYSVNIGPDGNIWIQRGTLEQPFFDIFDLEGTLIGHKVLPEAGWTWHFSMNEFGILGWEDDPELGFQQLFLIQ